MNNTFNVNDSLKTLSKEEIKEYYANNAIDAAAAMFHILGDFNLGSLIRSANFFGFKEALYIGGKKSYDKRSTVGTYNYIPTKYMSSEDDFLEYVENKYSIVCIENNIPEFSYKTVSLFDDTVFDNLKHPPIFIFGEEQAGISNRMLFESDRIITIPDYGTVRSLNVGCCASTVFSFYRKYYNQLNPDTTVDLWYKNNRIEINDKVSKFNS